MAKQDEAATSTNGDAPTNEAEAQVIPGHSPDEVVTPSQLATRVGVPAQMIYSYIKAGRIEAFEGNLEGKEREQLLIETDAAEAWAGEYLDRKQTRSASVEDLLEAVDNG